MSDLVNFKGMGDGVRIWLDATADFDDIISELDEKITESKAFFGDGNCSLRVFGRKLSEGDRKRLEKVTLTLLPSARISYEKTKERKPYAWLVEKAGDEKKAGVSHPAEPIIDGGSGDEPPARDEDAEQTYEGSKVVTEEEIFSVFRSNRARLYQGIAEAGMVIRSDGHLVFFGKVEKGASLIAVGNILVIGGLYGSAHAGCNGHDGSYIWATDMRPERLAIAGLEYDDCVAIGADEENVTAKKTPEEKKGLFGMFRKKDHSATESGVEVKDSSFSAVALCKKHKIEIDNFTIRTFTNG